MAKISPRRVRRLRKRLDLTQEEFAEKVGVSVPSIHRWENGITKPTGLAARRLIEVEKSLTPTQPTA